MGYYRSINGCLNMDKYKVIIGMEVHVELKTASKMFCGCKNEPFNAPEPNTYTCPVCLGLPGALPVANKKAIEWTIKLGLALGCKINMFSKFDRKHYFYPDLAKGYQISQYDLPFCYDGKVDTSFGPVGIRRIHLEEDTGKLIHDTVDGKKVSLIDFNRSGVPLVEIVTEPSIFSSAQAKEYAKKLRQIIRYLDISDADMEKGGMRLEANISLKKFKVQSSKLKINEGSENSTDELPGYKVELKNINSFRYLERGIEYEIKRQMEILEDGMTPVQETRGYNAEKNITYSQRTKEDAADYRYFPDPDLPPIRMSDDFLTTVKSSSPIGLEELFTAWKERYGLKREVVELLFETSTEANWLEGLFSLAKKEGVKVDNLVNRLVNKKLKAVLFEGEAKKIVDEYKKQTTVDDVTDGELKSIVEHVLKANQKAVADYRAGKTNVVNFLVGMVMREAKKKIEFGRVVKMITSTIIST